MKKKRKVKTKVCIKCQKRKKLLAFWKQDDGKYGVTSRCKKCRAKQIKINKEKHADRFKQYADTYYQKNKDNPEFKRKRRSTLLKSRFGINLEKYNKILLSQNNRCVICKKHKDNEKRALCVDHNHKTGHVRGLLCNYCNGRLLRYLQDNKNRAAGLVKYLSKALKNDTNWK